MYKGKNHCYCCQNKCLMTCFEKVNTLLFWGLFKWPIQQSTVLLSIKHQHTGIFRYIQQSA